MKQTHYKQNAGFLTLALRLVIGWTYFSALWRRTVLTDKLDPDLPGYIGEKFNHFLPHALGIKPIIQYLVEHPDALWINMLIFTIIEGLVGLFIILGLGTRLMGFGVLFLAMGILLGSGWIGTTCLDEWQIGILGIATGFTLFLTGSSHYSMDYWLLKKHPFLKSKKWFSWLGSGVLPIKESLFKNVVLIGSFSILAITLLTNQVFHGGLWGTLHNKSVKPNFELTEGSFSNNELSFDIYRTEGVDVYGAWVIEISVFDAHQDQVIQFDSKDLAALLPKQIDNYYVAKATPSQHSLKVPLGSKAKIHLNHPDFKNLPKGVYTITMTDISGAQWHLEIPKD
ncbi:quinol oxidase [Mangrovimonas sp. CR14]|uniref:TQO small subunit DoxD n=1 Tax=Mangrovimonas sp. CR14 TaxID=2706120 RepID=UPI00141F3EE2|nr:TQO small subunit DoxD [Mangrovimonas sp. CR14]NIK93579.1 quinol oxidase [Mangrovimonas sp. CR14]